MKQRILWLLIFPLILWSCSSTLSPQKPSYIKYDISAQQKIDSTIWNTILPYKDSIDQNMNEVIGYSETDLQKQQPEGTLGNFVCDALLAQSSKVYGKQIDFCLVNYGGIRLPSIAKGNVTLGKIYELLPFDNMLVIQQLTGKQVQQLCDLIVLNGGWPVSGITMELGNGAAKNIYVQKQLLDTTKTYSMLVSDYVANGGDKTLILKNIPQQNLNLLVRDALIMYIRNLTEHDENISAKIEGRIKLSE